MNAIDSITENILTSTVQYMGGYYQNEPGLGTLFWCAFRSPPEQIIKFEKNQKISVSSWQTLAIDLVNILYMITIIDIKLAKICVIHFLHHEKEITRIIEITRKRNVWFIIDFQIMDDAKEGLRCQPSHDFWPPFMCSHFIEKLEILDCHRYLRTLRFVCFNLRRFMPKHSPLIAKEANKYSSFLE